MSESESTAGLPGEETEPSAFEKLDLAKEHEDRAERLRAEAKRDVLETVSENIPLPAEIAVKIQNDCFVVLCKPKSIAESIEAELDEDVELLSSLRFRLGKSGSLDERERREAIKRLVTEIEGEYERGAPIDVVVERATSLGIDRDAVVEELKRLKQQGFTYRATDEHLRTTDEA